MDFQVVAVNETQRDLMAETSQNLQTCEDRYEILGEIGRGGFGVVWKARQRSTGQLCAIKTLLLDKIQSEDAAQRLLKRLEREMALIARLDSPHVVKLYDSGFTVNGDPFLALELLKGVDLRKILKAGPLRPEVAMRIMSQVLEALSNPHAQNIVHRDLKPENIMVSVLQHHVNAKILDFGIAGITETSGSTLVELTLDEEMLGTPCYMSPEQIRSSKTVSVAGDVYSLGLIFAEMLTGKKVVTGSNVHTILAQQIVTPVRLPDELAATSLGMLIEKAASKEEGDRYPNAAAMLEVLSEIDISVVPTMPGALSLDAIEALEKQNAEDIDRAVSLSTSGSVSLRPSQSRALSDATIAEQAVQRSGNRLALIVIVAVMLAFAAVLVGVSFSGSDEGAGEASTSGSERLSEAELEIDGLLAKARQAKRDGQLEEAIELYQEVIEKAPTHVVAREEMGWAQLSADHFKDAVVTFAKLERAEVKTETVLLGLGLAQDGAGDVDAASHAFQAFVQQYPQSQRRAEVELRLAAIQKDITSPNVANTKAPDATVPRDDGTNPVPEVVPDVEPAKVPPREPVADHNTDKKDPRKPNAPPVTKHEQIKRIQLFE